MKKKDSIKLKNPIYTTATKYKISVKRIHICIRIRIQKI